MNTRASLVLFALAMSLAASARGDAQQAVAAQGEPRTFDTYTPGPCSPNGQPHGGCAPGTRHRIRVVPVATGLTTPWHMAFLPDGRMLVAEAAQLRSIRDNVLDPRPIAGWPPASLGARALNSVLVHPQFAQNRFLYFWYIKVRQQDQATTMALARGRLDDMKLTEVGDLFVADAWLAKGPIAGRAAFGPDGMIYASVNDHDEFNAIDNTTVRILAQDLGSDLGKVLRLRDDGSVPPDNPFVRRSGANGQVFTYGHRNVTGLAWHPTTGELWSTEIGPMGGDELNVLKPGQNYGWPHVSFGRLYTNKLVSEQSWHRPGMEMPVMFWVPAISPSGLTFYNGDRFPWWKGHLFLGALSGQMLQRVAFDQPPPQGERREALLTQLDRRVRHVVQGPDGYLYISTETRTQGAGQPNADPPGNGGVFRIEPVD